MDRASEGHPRGLYTLFFTEMWERFSYYGMRALLVLFMVTPVAQGGLGFRDEVATAIYGLYTAGVYLAALPGGWLGDRVLGGPGAVWVGGWIIAGGHFCLAVPGVASFFAGLILVVLGTGLLKPNISALVGTLYPEGGARRDAGFTLFYMGINLGAALGPLVCSFLGERVGWHYGFGAAGVGMVLGLVQFALTRRHLVVQREGPEPVEAAPLSRTALVIAGLLAAALGAVAVAGWTGMRVDPVGLARKAAGVIAGLAVAYFVWALTLARISREERRRVAVILILFAAAALFWSGYEQAGSSLNLFAERYTDRQVGSFEIPAGWFQAVPAVFVIVFAPGFAWLWVRLARRGRDPSPLTKLGGGLLLLAVGFGVLVPGSRRALEQGSVWPTWLLATFLFQVFGELMLSPVGLSAVTKLAPARLVGQMMGVWFLAASLGNLLAGLLAGNVTGERASAMPGQFGSVALGAGVAGLVLLMVSRPVQRWMTPSTPAERG